MFKNPFSFDGRIRRTEYGVSFIIYVVIAVIVNAIISSSSDAAIIGIAYIPMLWFLWAQGAKRCHDVGNNGWWQIIPFYALWLLFQDGQPGATAVRTDAGSQVCDRDGRLHCRRRAVFQVAVGAGPQGVHHHPDGEHGF